MDELDKLKNIWDSISNSVIDKNLSTNELRRIVERKSKSEILKVKRKFIAEWVLSIILSLLLVGYVYVFESSMTLYSIGLVFILFAVSLIPFIKIIEQKSISHIEIKEYLKLFIERYEQLVENIVRLHTFLIPFGILGGYMLGYATVVSNISGFELTVKDCGLCLIIIVPITVIAYLLSKRYSYWVYGKNIKRLKECLAELEKEE